MPPKRIPEDAVLRIDTRFGALVLTRRMAGIIAATLATAAAFSLIGMFVPFLVQSYAPVDRYVKTNEFTAPDQSTDREGLLVYIDVDASNNYQTLVSVELFRDEGDRDVWVDGWRREFVIARGNTATFRTFPYHSRTVLLPGTYYVTAHVMFTTRNGAERHYDVRTPEFEMHDPAGEDVDDNETDARIAQSPAVGSRPR